MTAAAALGGFFVGSAVTLAALHYTVGLPFAVGRSDDGDADEKEPLLRLGAGGRGKTSDQQLRGSAFALAKLSSEGFASAGFLCDVVAHLWNHLSPAIGSTIKEVVEPMFAELLPGPLSTLHFAKIDLGTVPLRLTNIVVHTPKKGTVQFDVDVTWESDCDIELRAVMGSVLGNIDLGVEALKLRGRLSVWLSPLTDTLPVVSAVQYAFLNPPEIELDFTGVASVANISLVDKTIRKIIDDILASMLVLPNRMLFKLDPTASVLQTYLPPLGVARITCLSGHGFRTETTVLGGRDVPDCYCNVTFCARPIPWRTSTIKDSESPRWDESADFILSDHDQRVSIEVYDEDRSPVDPDDFLGRTSVTVGEIMIRQGRTATLELEDDKGRGTGAHVTVRCDLHELSPVYLQEGLRSTANRGSNRMCGLATILVAGAFDVPLTEEEAVVGTHVRVTAYGAATGTFVTGVVAAYPGMDASNPSWDASFHVPLTTELLSKVRGGGDAANDAIVFELMNGERVVGFTAVTHGSLLSSKDYTVAERRRMTPPQGLFGGAFLEFSVSLSGTSERCISEEENATASTEGNTVSSPTTTATTSFGDSTAAKVRLTAVKGRGFVVQKKKLGKDDIPDCYCRVEIDSQVWKTSTVRNHTAPNWGESHDFVTADPDLIVSLDVFDEDKGRKDDELGGVKLTVADLMRASAAGKPMEVELRRNGRGTGSYVTLRCVRLEDARTSSDTGVKTKSETTAPEQFDAGEAPEELTPVPSVAGNNDGAPDVLPTPTKVAEEPGPVSSTATKPSAAVEDADLGDGVGNHSTSPAAPATAAVAAASTGAIEADGIGGSGGVVRVTAVKGRGFRIEKRRLGKADVPDCYCIISVGATASNKKTPRLLQKLQKNVWKTSTKKNDVEPHWNESHDFTTPPGTSTVDELISVRVMDEDKGSTDDELGSAEVAIGELLGKGGGLMELELRTNGKRVGSFVTLRCAKV